MSQDQKSDELVWYFAYGSNMNAKTQKRRKCVPRQGIAAQLDGWRLTYDLRGAPFVEPAFADIEPLGPNDKDIPPVQGVLLQITQAEFDGIVATEGGGGVTKNGYHVIEVEPVPLRGDKTPIKAQTLSVGPNPLGRHHGNFFPPSQRYLNLLIDGAKHYQLSDNYIKWLEQHTVYDRKRHVPNTLVFYALFAFLILFAIPIVLSFALNSIFIWRIPKEYRKKWLFALHTFAQFMSRVIWGLHNSAALILGPLGLIVIEKAGNKGILLKSAQSNGNAQSNGK